MAISVGDNDTITVRELVEAFQRRYRFFTKEQAAERAHTVMADIVAHREPEYEVGEVYRDAYREIWQYLPGVSGKPWRIFGSGERFRYETPKRPLRKLVPEQVEEDVPPLTEAEKEAANQVIRKANYVHRLNFNDGEQLREY